MKEIMLRYSTGSYSGDGFLTFYYVEGEGYKAMDIVVVEFEIRHKRLKLRTVKDPKYLGYCKMVARAWVKENRGVL